MPLYWPTIILYMCKYILFWFVRIIIVTTSMTDCQFYFYFIILLHILNVTLIYSILRLLPKFHYYYSLAVTLKSHLYQTRVCEQIRFLTMRWNTISPLYMVCKTAQNVLKSLRKVWKIGDNYLWSYETCLVNYLWGTCIYVKTLKIYVMPTTAYRYMNYAACQ